MRIHFVHGMLAGVAALALFAAGARAEKPAATGEEQAAAGAKLYAKHCAKCHGDAGQGKKAPAVVGKDALPLDPPANAKLRKTQFHTAQDVAAFVAANMPPKKGGSLTTDQYYEILAFDLKANGVDVSGKKIDPTTAAEIKLH
ncbi:MAG TPA: c-type cytochrome [Polyangia bacterium]|nr:c-type cytochrome [Polyangia bacterium]